MVGGGGRGGRVGGKAERLQAGEAGPLRLGALASAANDTSRASAFGGRQRRGPPSLPPRDPTRARFTDRPAGGLAPRSNNAATRFISMRAARQRWTTGARAARTACPGGRCRSGLSWRVGTGDEDRLRGCWRARAAAGEGGSCSTCWRWRERRRQRLVGTAREMATGDGQRRRTAARCCCWASDCWTATMPTWAAGRAGQSWTGRSTWPGAAPCPKAGSSCSPSAGAAVRLAARATPTRRTTRRGGYR